MEVKSRFLKPGDSHTHAQDRSDADPSTSTTFVHNPNHNLALQAQRRKLPVFALRTHILHLAQKFRVVIVVGETGSGKSTQIPQYLRESGWGRDGLMIGVTEPRRIACTSLAERVAEESEVCLGREVGYSIRFDDNTTPKVTQIKYLTEATLTREMMADPLLRQYSLVMVDEVHERTLHTDIILGLLRKVQKRRRDLTVIISSASMDAEELFAFFNTRGKRSMKNEEGKQEEDTAVIISVEGRTYPVDVFYLKDSVADYVKASVETVLKIHLKEGPGGVLVFLTGQEEVDVCVNLLREENAKITARNKGRMLVLPLHGSLPNHDLSKPFHIPPKGERKVVVATNLAETSLTIPDVSYVVDSGFVKVRWFDGHSDSLCVVPTSKASANQRAGRAGRTRSGHVYRLYREEDFDSLPKATPPEMVRLSLTPAVLSLMALGIDNMLRFPFPSPPPSGHLVTALDDLYALGAIGQDGTLTKPLGVNMARLPLHPTLAKVLLDSESFGCSEEVLSILSMLQVRDVFVQPRGQMKHTATLRHREFQVKEGDTITLLNVYNSYVRSGESKKWCAKYFINSKALRRAVELRSRMERVLKDCALEVKSCQGDITSILKAITSGLFLSAAYLHHSGAYKSIKRGEGELYIHPTSSLYTQTQPQWVVYNELLHTTRSYMRDLTVIDPAWLLELAPHYYEKTTLAS